MQRTLTALLALLFALPVFAQANGYTSITPNGSGAAAITWNSSATYKQGQIVTYSGLGYISLTFNNSGNTPSAGSAYWAALGSASGPANGVLGTAQNYGSIVTFGDSITEGTGSSNFMSQGSLGRGYAQRLISDFGGQGQDYGVGGDQAADMVDHLIDAVQLHPGVTRNPVVSMMISTNDVNVYGTNANQENIFQRALGAAIAAAAVPEIAKAYTAGSACTRSGTWTADGPKIYATAAGASLTCSVTTYSTGLLVTIAAGDTWGGTASITVDGSTPSGDTATLLSGGQGGAKIATANGISNTYQLYSYPSIQAGTHTVVLTTTNSSIFEPLSISSAYPASPAAVAPPLVVVGGTPWNAGNTPSSVTSTYNSLIQTEVSTLASLSLPVYFVDIRNGVNTRNGNTATPLNSTTDYSGGTLANGFVCPASAYPPYHPDDCGHEHLAENFEAAIGIKSGGPSMTPVVSGSLLGGDGFSNLPEYALSLTGDLRLGAVAGMAYGYPGDNTLHILAPSGSGGFTFALGNSPGVGAAGTETVICTLTTSGFSSGCGASSAGSYSYTGSGNSVYSATTTGTTGQAAGYSLNAPSSNNYTLGCWGTGAMYGLASACGLYDNTTSTFVWVTNPSDDTYFGVPYSASANVIAGAGAKFGLLHTGATVGFPSSSGASATAYGTPKIDTGSNTNAAAGASLLPTSSFPQTDHTFFVRFAPTSSVAANTALAQVDFGKTWKQPGGSTNEVPSCQFGTFASSAPMGFYQNTAASILILYALQPLVSGTEYIISVTCDGDTEQ